MEVKLVDEATELHDILRIQKENHFKNLSKTSIENGFVTVQYDFDTLDKMNVLAKHVIARSDNQVVGYALTMVKACKKMVPVLVPMFDAFEDITYNGVPLNDLNYYVMGQICVKDGFKRKGILRQLYAKHKEMYASQFDYCITEISSKNIPSMHAHQKVGFKTIHTFTDDADEWNVVLWDWNSPLRV